MCGCVDRVYKYTFLLRSWSGIYIPKPHLCGVSSSDDYIVINSYVSPSAVNTDVEATPVFA